jgi:hypothetical protein
MGLLQSIRYRRTYNIQPELLVTQNKLKLLTILANLLASHLSMIERELTFDFIKELSKLINHSLKKNRDFDQSLEQIYNSIKDKIPKKHEPSILNIGDKQLQSLLIPFGFNLLLELTYIFIILCKNEVVPEQLKNMILKEFTLILESLAKAENFFFDKI